MSIKDTLSSVLLLAWVMYTYICCARAETHRNRSPCFSMIPCRLATWTNMLHSQSIMMLTYCGNGTTQMHMMNRHHASHWSSWVFPLEYCLWPHSACVACHCLSQQACVVHSSPGSTGSCLMHPNTSWWCVEILPCTGCAGLCSQYRHGIAMCKPPSS